MADPQQLTQMFQNLLSNALKFRGDAPPRVTVEAAADDRGWQLLVSDNGIGIAQEDRGKVFDMFKRIHGRDVYPGDGIGLSVVKRIAERHQGSIEIRENDGGGCRFVITLPARSEAEQES